MVGWSVCVVFFFKQKTAYEMRISDWSSDVCSSDLFIAGVSGPLLDVFFVRSSMDRRAVVATKAACQTLSHLAKLIYFAHAMGGESGADEVAMGIDRKSVV